MNIRVIARLDIKGPNLVKGVHLEGLRILGRPELFAPQYYQDGADELIYIDTVASLYGRNNLVEIVKRAAENIYIPLTVGGGVRSVEDMQTLLRAGADKIAINSAAIANPQLILEGSRVFGSQCIVVSIQARQFQAGKYECLTDNAREKTSLDVLDWARRVVDLGAGEILLTSVDREGTGKGYDVELVERVASRVPIPVIAHGGAGKKEHVLEVITQGKADAVCAASIFHYGILGLSLKTEYKEEGNTEFLKGTLPLESFGRKTISPVRIRALKQFLRDAGATTRIPIEPILVHENG